MQMGKLTAEDILKILIDVFNEQHQRELTKCKISEKEKAA